MTWGETSAVRLHRWHAGVTTALVMGFAVFFALNVHGLFGIAVAMLVLAALLVSWHTECWPSTIEVLDDGIRFGSGLGKYAPWPSVSRIGFGTGKYTNQTLQPLRWRKEYAVPVWIEDDAMQFADAINPGSRFVVIDVGTRKPIIVPLESPDQASELAFVLTSKLIKFRGLADDRSAVFLRAGSDKSDTSL